MSRNLFMPSLCRQSLGAFVCYAFGVIGAGRRYTHNWHVEVVCWQLQEMMAGRLPRELVLCQPPRSLKSFIVSVCLPAWLLGRNPGLSIIVASYADGLAGKLSRDCRTLMESAFYASVFPHTQLSDRKSTELEFETTAGGGRYTATVGGSLTGRGADVLIVDDPMKAQDRLYEKARTAVVDWFNSTAYTRRNSAKESSVIVTMQRLHEDDLAGHLIRAGWPSLVLPARATCSEEFRLSAIETYTRKAGELLQQTRDTDHSLDTIERQLGSHDFSAQYQQDPLPAEGNIVKASSLVRYTQVPQRRGLSEVVIACDPASKPGEHNDFTAIVAALITDNKVYVLESARGHWTYHQAYGKMLELARKYEANTLLVEDTSIGPVMIEDLRANQRAPVLAWKPRTSKLDRMHAQQGKFEGGIVRLPRDHHWSAEFEKELLGFPNARYDDQVDALLMILERYGKLQAIRSEWAIIMPIIVTSPKDSFGF